LKEGDLVSIDLGVILNGWHGDHAYTFILGEVAPELLQLVKELVPKRKNVTTTG
jgi:methionyl aminopeptidase